MIPNVIKHRKNPTELSTVFDIQRCLKNGFL